MTPFSSFFLLKEVSEDSDKRMQWLGKEPGGFLGLVPGSVSGVASSQKQTNKQDVEFRLLLSGVGKSPKFLPLLQPVLVA